MPPLGDRPDRPRASSADDDLELRVRTRLRALRNERMLTLAEAARRAGMDPSALSRLESGARRLTFAHLPPLARALGVSAQELLTPAVAVTAPAPQRPRPWRACDGSTYLPLGSFAPGEPRTCKVLLPAELRDPAPSVHAGHQWLHVLSGRLRLRLGDAEQVLAPGEAAQFSTWTPHWSGVVEEPVELLVTFDPEASRHG